MCTNVHSNYVLSGAILERVLNCMVGLLVQYGQASLLYCIQIALATQEYYTPVLYPGLDYESVAIYEIITMNKSVVV